MKTGTGKGRAEALPLEERRSTRARVGLCALNIVHPGLGLIRLGHLKLGAVFLLAPIVILLLFAGLAALAPVPGFHMAVAVFALLLGTILFIIVSAIILSWKWSRARNDLPWWSRWYVLVGLWLVLSLAQRGVVGLIHDSYKPFYLVSESMVPTVRRGERILVEMRSGWPMGRGRVVLVRDGSDVRVYRVAALAGDVIEMRDGIPLINGKPAKQADAGPIRISFPGMAGARLRTEQLPGETGSHRIVEAGVTGLDFLGPVRVPRGHIFVLGDNRDLSADSRVPASQMGVGMVPLEKVVGRPLFIHLSGDPDRIGTHEGF